MQKILVCDDDRQIVEAIDIYLTGEGFEVIKAYDGLEALELLKTHEVNLMIVDVMMPGLDGIRTTLKVRETSSIPIIILSSQIPVLSRIHASSVSKNSMRSLFVTTVSGTYEPIPMILVVMSDSRFSVCL